MLNAERFVFEVFALSSLFLNLARFFFPVKICTLAVLKPKDLDIYIL